MKYYLAFLFFAASFFTFSQGTSLIWKVSKDSIEEYHPFFNDEFHGDKINKEKWLDIYQWGGLDFKTRMFAAPEMTYVSDGILTLGADTTSQWYAFPDWVMDSAQIKKYDIDIRENKMQLNYLTSVIFSKEKFRYGYFECKAKAPSGQGLWPAFWLYGGEPNEEIDFMEMKGEKHKEMHVDVHCPNHCTQIKMKSLPFIKQRWGGWLKFNKDLVDEWVIYSGLWEPGRITFYVNGDVVAEYAGDFKTSMHLITNLSIAVDNGPFKPGINKKTILPNAFEVDYIRVWQNTTDFQKSSKKIDFGKDQPRVFNPIKKTKLKTKKKVMLRRKSLKNELGYLTMMMTEKNQLQFSKNGSGLSRIQVEILSNEGKLISSHSINQQTDLVDISSLKKGTYKVKIKHLNQEFTSDFTW